MEWWNRILKQENSEIHLEYWLYDDGNGNKQFKINHDLVLFGVGERDCVERSLAMKAM